MTIKATAKLTEQEYRKIRRDSYSSIKTFAESRWKYYKEYVLYEKEPDAQSNDSIMGNLVDCMLTDEENFENRFLISSAIIPKDTSNGYKFVIKLFDITKRATSEEGDVGREMIDMMQEAYNIVGIKKPGFEKWVEDFDGSDLEIWYNELRGGLGKTVVSVQQVKNAEDICNTLKRNDNTREIITLVDDKRWNVHNQLPVMFSYKRKQLKMLADKVVVDHENKRIYPYDLKCTWNVTEFPVNYLKVGYYIQGCLYRMGLYQWAIDNDMKDYVVETMTFIACHSANLEMPLLWKTSEKDCSNALEGFSSRGRNYRGVNCIIEDLLWHESSGLWNTSRTAYENGGKLNMDINYDY